MINDISFAKFKKFFQRRHICLSICITRNYTIHYFFSFLKYMLRCNHNEGTHTHSQCVHTNAISSFGWMEKKKRKDLILTSQRLTVCSLFQLFYLRLHAFAPKTPKINHHFIRRHYFPIIFKIDRLKNLCPFRAQKIVNTVTKHFQLTFCSRERKRLSAMIFL